MRLIACGNDKHDTLRHCGTDGSVPGVGGRAAAATRRWSPYGSVPPRLRLATMRRSGCSSAHEPVQSMAQMSPDTVPEPALSSTRSAQSRAPGATPTAPGCRPGSDDTRHMRAVSVTIRDIVDGSPVTRAVAAANDIQLAAHARVGTRADAGVEDGDIHRGGIDHAAPPTRRIPTGTDWESDTPVRSGGRGRADAARNGGPC